MLLKSCSRYWRVAHVTEELLMLLKSCSCYWRVAHVTEELLMLLKSCSCYWRVAHVTEELLMLLKSCSMWFMHLASVLHKFGIVRRQTACSYPQNRVQIWICYQRPVLRFIYGHAWKVCSQICWCKEYTHFAGKLFQMTKLLCAEWCIEFREFHILEALLQSMICLKINQF